MRQRLSHERTESKLARSTDSEQGGINPGSGFSLSEGLWAWNVLTGWHMPTGSMQGHNAHSHRRQPCASTNHFSVPSR